ncbi:hypothetical protein [Paenibacillus sp. OAS669]|uniref:hypothetical protein n=1 Tax=Paenibacillus sp. OAS669 TaxID=2663821 RepID=UPI00178A3AC3|nr:hypothetical protein [Paenibacillus sp. OAS669]MBE1442967.1 hypothetical protein [Paenibacillus sp. OAS669]
MSLETAAKQIDELAIRDQADSINLRILSLSSSDQLSIHGLLDPGTLEYITMNRVRFTFDDAVKEHIVWACYRNQEWSDALLLKLIKEYKQDPYVALESIIINAVTRDQVTKEQIDLILQHGPDNDGLRRQIYFWSVRNQLETRHVLSTAGIQTLQRVRGYDLLIRALDERLINEADLELFQKPEAGERDRKQKEKLYAKAIGYKGS